MPKINFKKVVMFFLISTMFVFAVAPLLTKAQLTADDLSEGFNELETETGMAYDKTPVEIVVGIINIVLGFLGLIAVILILIGGFKWMTAGGNEDQVGDAKKWIYSGVIGMLIILASYALANFVLEKLLVVTTGA